MRCEKCGSVYAVSAENAELWNGAPCQRSTCGGFLEKYETGEINYYGRLYSAGDLVRINAREHTGLLERPNREQLETDFKRGKDTQELWDPNVLSCTPTLEMGIDIGDLSTVILCSMPPAQSQFLQRAGRAGRKDGNALTLAIANAKPHDLYFYADPLEMIAGNVTPPKIFLKASAVLERQFVAFCMDSWVKKGIPDGAIPDKVGVILKKLDSRPDDMLGMKEYFGNVDHLRATVSEVPVPDADYRKQYLVIYDSVPGGTGYLKQLMHEKNALIEIFEKALHVMENCSCKDDPQKDGCYHCLYAYRQSQQIGNISRAAAIRMLKAILSGRDNVQKIDKINDIPVNPLFDSELEQRFMEAVRTKIGAANVSDTIRNGKHSYYVKLDNTSWEIEPQVYLDESNGVSVPCKPDFVFWPVSAPDHKPVAVFTDGFLYHKDIVSDDTIKREAIRRSGNFRVWSLSFKDVQSVFAPQGDFYTETLEAEKMPSGKTMYQNMIKKHKADSIEPAKLSSFDLLIEYLQLPDAEKVFKGQAYAYSLSLLEPALLKNSLAFNNWKIIVDAVNEQTHFTDADFVFPGTVFGSWIPRNSNAHLAIHSAILASELKAEGAVAVCAVLNDEKDHRTDKYEQEWNGFWRFHNLMQFSDEFIAVSSTGMSRMDYLALPVSVNAVSDPVVPVTEVDDAWDAIIELMFDDDAKAFVELARDAGVPAPDEDNIGYEVEGDDGEVIATVEIAWPDKHVGFMTADQAEDKEKLENMGWKIINLLDAADMDTASLFGGDN